MFGDSILLVNFFFCSSESPNVDGGLFYLYRAYFDCGYARICRGANSLHLLTNRIKPPSPPQYLSPSLISRTARHLICSESPLPSSSPEAASPSALPTAMKSPSTHCGTPPKKFPPHLPTSHRCGLQRNYPLLPCRYDSLLAFRSLTSPPFLPDLLSLPFWNLTPPNFTSHLPRCGLIANRGFSSFALEFSLTSSRLCFTTISIISRSDLPIAASGEIPTSLSSSESTSPISPPNR